MSTDDQKYYDKLNPDTTTIIEGIIFSIFLLYLLLLFIKSIIEVINNMKTQAIKLVKDIKFIKKIHGITKYKTISIEFHPILNNFRNSPLYSKLTPQSQRVRKRRALNFFVNNYIISMENTINPEISDFLNDLYITIKKCNFEYTQSTYCALSHCYYLINHLHNKFDNKNEKNNISGYKCFDFFISYIKKNQRQSLYFDHYANLIISFINNRDAGEGEDNQINDRYKEAFNERIKQILVNMKKENNDFLENNLDKIIKLAFLEKSKK